MFVFLQMLFEISIGWSEPPCGASLFALHYI
jgi:hypothetical protein